MVDDVERVHQKVDERAARRHRPVGLARLVDLEARGLRDAHLLGDLDHGRLGHLERDDELLVAEDVPLGRGEPMEQVVLQLLQLDRELVLLLDQLGALLLQVGPLLVDDHREQLVLQPALGHGEVDQRRLRLQLGDVVRVGQLRLQVQPEERLVGDVVRLVTPQRHVDLGERRRGQQGQQR